MVEMAGVEPLLKNPIKTAKQSHFRIAKPFFQFIKLSVCTVFGAFCSLLKEKVNTKLNTKIIRCFCTIIKPLAKLARAVFFAIKRKALSQKLRTKIQNQL